MIITITHGGYIKRTATSAYRAQRRGGRGVTGADTKDDSDFVEHLFTARAHDFLMFCTDNGRVYCEKVYDIPEAGRAARDGRVTNGGNKEAALEKFIRPLHRARSVAQHERDNGCLLYTS
ncbi:MAG: hypothetical protein N2689_02670, partial [Verrucomicrobiae bacterium]|nr:hypothetical protein [Verrucomicrobiae bacterium]